MALILNEVIDDTEKQGSGVWVQYDEDVSFLIASNQSPSYKKALMKKAKDMPKHISQEKADEIYFDLLSQHILKDWKGVSVIDAKGKATELKYTPEVGKEWLKKSATIRDVVESSMNNRTLFMAEKVEEVAKN